MCGRRRPDGSLEDLGRLPGDNPVPDGMKVGADGRLYVTDIVAGGIHVLAPDGRAQGFLACGVATTNCVFSGETLWVTNAGVLATGTEPSFAGTLCRLHVPGGGGPTYVGPHRSRRIARERASHETAVQRGRDARGGPHGAAPPGVRLRRRGRRGRANPAAQRGRVRRCRRCCRAP